MYRLFISLSVCLLSLQVPISAQISGCTDPLANNYQPAATSNDGSCTYNPATITSPIANFPLDSLIPESSGLILWNGTLLTQNDNTDTRLYAIDTANGQLKQSYSLSNVVNKDWEALAQDSLYAYLGDVGNNVNGNRKDLRIIRVLKSTLTRTHPALDTISFSYPDQTDFSPQGNNNTDFDCEAMIVTKDSIFLFTKQWISKQTTIYALPKLPGDYSAIKRATLAVDGLVSDACYLPEKRLIVLIGYSTLVQPFFFLLYDFHPTDFLSGNKRKIDLAQSFKQVEGIATKDGLRYFVTNEHFQQGPFNTAASLQIFDLKDYLSGYVQAANIVAPLSKGLPFQISPNPGGQFIRLQCTYNGRPIRYQILNEVGKIVLQDTVNASIGKVDISRLLPGMYQFVLPELSESAQRFFKK